MNGFKARTLWLGGVAAGLLSLAGCSCGPCGYGGNQCKYKYDDLVDPCYPQRYVYETRALVREPLETQAHNGLVLDQTIWNHHFERGTDKLTRGGKLRIDQLMRRRPAPVPEMYLQTAIDMPEAAPPEGGVQPTGMMMADDADTCAARRAKLNDARKKAIERYLADCHPGWTITLVVHNPTVPGMHIGEAGTAVIKNRSAVVGTQNDAIADANRAERVDRIERRVDQNIDQNVDQKIDQKVQGGGPVEAPPPANPD